MNLHILITQACVVDLVLSHRVFCGRVQHGSGRQPQNTCMFQRAAHVVHHSWAASLGALPAQGKPEQSSACHSTNPDDGWAAICEEQSQGLISSTVNCYEAVFMTTEIKLWLPAWLQQPPAMLGKTLHLSGQVCSGLLHET